MKRWKINWTLWRTTRKFERQHRDRDAWLQMRENVIEIIWGSAVMDQAILRMTRRGRDVLWYSGHLRSRFEEQIRIGSLPPPPPKQTLEDIYKMTLALHANEEKATKALVKKLGDKEPVNLDARPDLDDVL